MSEGLALIPKNILTTAPYTIYQAGLLAWIITGKPYYGFFTLLAIILGDGMNAIEKIIAKRVMGKDSTIGQRPSGCGNLLDKNCTGCGIYPVYGKLSHTWGMPSGHAQITTFASTYWTIYVWMKYKEETNFETKQQLKKKAIITSLSLWILSFAVWFQRVYSGCHNILQIITGIVIGMLLGYLGYWFSTLLFKDLPKIKFQ